MANFEAFRMVISSSINLFFLKSEIQKKVHLHHRGGKWATLYQLSYITRYFDFSVTRYLVSGLDKLSNVPAAEKSKRSCDKVSQIR